MQNKWNDLAIDKDNLFEGKLGIGDWPVHIKRYEGLRVGLQRMVDRALSKGCVVPSEAYEALSKPAPLFPYK